MPETGLAYLMNTPTRVNEFMAQEARKRRMRGRGTPINRGTRTRELGLGE